MPENSLILPLQNDSDKPLKIVLEPLSEYFILPPGRRAEVHASFRSEKLDSNFTIAPNDDFLVIYASGEIGGFVGLLSDVRWSSPGPRRKLVGQNFGKLLFLRML